MEILLQDFIGDGHLNNHLGIVKLITVMMQDLHDPLAYGGAKARCAEPPIITFAKSILPISLLYIVVWIIYRF